MIDLDNNANGPSEVFDKGPKKKRGLLARLGFGGGEDVRDLGHIDDYDDPPAYNYDASYIDDESADTTSVPSTPTTSGRRSAISLLDDDDYDGDEVTPPPPPPVGRGKSSLLGLLSDDDDEENLVLPPIEEEYQDEIPAALPTEEETFVPPITSDNEDDLFPLQLPGEENSSAFQEDEIPPVLTVEEKLPTTTTNVPPPDLLEPTYQQTVEEVVRQEADPLEIRADILANAGYVEIIESLVTKVMLHHEVPNISLESFGAVASTYEPNTLEITSFGNHKFAGNPLTDKQKIILFLQIEKLTEKAKEENKDQVVLSATQRIQHEGIIYRTLLLSDDLLEDYMNAYDRTIMTNGDVASLEELAVIIKL